MFKKLKILQITNRVPYPLNDGGNIATYYVAKYLHDFGHEITLASLNTKKHFCDPSPLEKMAKVHTVNIDTTFQKRGFIKGFFSSLPYNVSRFYSKVFEDKLIAIISNEKFDIIQLEGIYLALYLPALRKHSDAKILLRSHNIESEIWERVSREELNPVKKLVLKHLYKKIRAFEIDNFHKFDGIIAITERDAEFYKTNGYKGSLITIPVGADLTLYQKISNDHHNNSICFLGSLEWIPNQQGLIWFLNKVWQGLQKNNPNIELHIAGKNPPERFKKLKIDGVLMHGEVPSAVDFLNEHQILIVPLLSGGGMRLKIIEAMALGKCVVSTSIGAEGINIQDGRNIMIADTSEAFIDKISNLLRDKNLRETISENALVQARSNYSWENLVREFESFYLKVI